MTFIEQEPQKIEEEPEWDSDEMPTETEADAEAAPTTHSLFDGDEGGLELDERKALVVLLKNRFITSDSHPPEWRAIVKSRKAIAERLNDLFLELVISLDREVAYKRPISGSREFPTLLHDTRWPREETALLVYLRVRARNEQARGEAHARVSRAEMLEYLQENRPESATDRVSDDGRGERAIGALKTAGLLVKTDEDGVFRISPAIEPMLPVTALNNLLAWLKVRTASESDSEPESTTEESE
ncbi:DUF4194 domain-containing protein [Leifsonia soli]|uniref:DUF4194 domain-containing protein n=1 Tax=Leifsonia soli TaxID=582665 RepID=A0A852T1F3_9MICO|nr:hypothetical protein [Leifsonia soli]